MRQTPDEDAHDESGGGVRHSAQPGQGDASEALIMGVQLHQQGHLDAAQELYRRLLELDPRNANALHCMGVLLHARGRSEEAIDLRLGPDIAATPSNLGAQRESALDTD